MTQLTRKENRKKNPLYSVWRNMRRRCLTSTYANYPYYGGRGITICKEWSEKSIGFTSFNEWAISNGYAKGLTLDRIDSNGNYAPSNCRWATWSEQQRNIRKNRYLTYRGETKLLIDWANLLGIDKGTIAHRQKIGWPIDKILSTRKFRNRRS